ncbi:SPOSA6832_00993 [Sporobolomyces salmonicolor]|uniref:Phosphotransferase n=1 Tax=Sporidiobolus salmonicolor TaxID=5005 RepID=A0A0D6EHP0_SPOSA|nr:SPOSA6832_00993 [Sporobolomyces salmonicolor]
MCDVTNPLGLPRRLGRPLLDRDWRRRCRAREAPSRIHLQFPGASACVLRWSADQLDQGLRRRVMPYHCLRQPSRPHLKNPRKLACEKVSLASLRERRQQRTDGALPSPDDFRNVPRRVTRNVLLHLVDSQVLFKGYSSTALNRHYGLDTAVMSALEAYTVPNSKESGDPIFTIGDVITSHLGIALLLVEDADALAAARVSEIVGTLGCRLSACAIAATPDGKRVILGLDGLIFGFYPRFEERVRTALKELLGGDVEKRGAIVMAEDGSGVGAMAMEQKGATVVS